MNQPMNLFSFFVLILIGLSARVTGAAVRADSIPPKRAMPSTYQQAPPLIILPGTQLNPSFRSLAAQDPAVRRAAPAWLRAHAKGDPTYVLDGNVATISQLKRLRQTDIVSITTLDGEKAASLYGANARQGLLLITTKAAQ